MNGPNASGRRPGGTTVKSSAAEWWRRSMWQPALLENGEDLLRESDGVEIAAAHLELQ
jgi:hypothetical protein